MQPTFPAFVEQSVPIKSGKRDEYDDAAIVYDPDFDDYEWKRTDMDPIKDLKEK